MNKERRTRISAVIQKLGECKDEITILKQFEKAEDGMTLAHQSLEICEGNTEAAILNLEGIE